MGNMGWQVATLPVSQGVLALRDNALGRLREEDVQRAFIFNAGHDCLIYDPLTRFYDEDMAELDWARDYLLVAEIAPPEEDFEASFEDCAKESDELLYSKADLTSTAADAGWADM